MAPLCLVLLVAASAWHSVQSQDCMTDVLFVIDATGSVKDDFDNHLQFARGVTEGLTVDEENIQVSVVEYASRYRRHMPITPGKYKGKDELLAMIDALPHYSGTTDTEAALEFAADKIKAHRRKDANLEVVVIHDGFSQSVGAKGAEKFKNERNARVLAVAVAETIWKEEMQSIATREDLYFEGMGTVGDVVKAIKDSCQPAEPTTTTTTTRRTTTKRTTKKPTTRPTTKRTTTTTTTVPTTTTTIFEGCRLDMVFIMDSSGSVNKVFEQELEQAVEFASGLELGPKNARVALVRFAHTTKTKVQFGFDEHQNLTSLLAAIRKTPYLRGTTDIKKALDLTTELMKDVRKDAAPVIILFSDGYSTFKIAKSSDKLHEVVPDAYFFAIAHSGIGYKRSELMKITRDDERIYDDTTFDQFIKDRDQLLESCRRPRR